MTTPAQYRERWPHSVTATDIAAGVTELYQSRLRETTNLRYRRVGFAESLLLSVLREAHQGEASS